MDRINFWKRLRPIIRKEFRQIFRDKLSLYILFFLPVFLLLLFGYALSFDIRHIRLSVRDLDQSARSRDFVNSLLHSEYFDLTGYLKEDREIDDTIMYSRSIMVMVIPREFGKKIHAGENVTVQVIIDGSNSNMAVTAVGYMGMFANDYSEKILTQFFAHQGRNKYTPIEMESRVWYNPELKSSTYLVTGLIVYILMIVAVISTAITIVREKERGTMEQIMVSPIHAGELVLGKTIPYVFISLGIAAMILIAGALMFGIAIKGNLILLALSILLFLIVALEMGVLVSTIADTQETAFMAAAFLSVLPTIILSGFVFPIASMPKAVQLITYLIPARYFLVILRGIILKGAGFFAYWENYLVMIFFAVALYVISSRRMSRILA